MFNQPNFSMVLMAKPGHPKVLFENFCRLLEWCFCKPYDQWNINYCTQLQSCKEVRMCKLKKANIKSRKYAHVWSLCSYAEPLTWVHQLHQQENTSLLSAFCSAAPSFLNTDITVQCLHFSCSDVILTTNSNCCNSHQLHIKNSYKAAINCHQNLFKKYAAYLSKAKRQRLTDIPHIRLLVAQVLITRLIED